MCTGIYSRGAMMAPSWPPPRSPCCASPLATSSPWGALEGAKMSQLPIWMQYLTAISTPVIALMVAVIAFAQWRTARQRMIVDLFQRRMDLIDLISRIASTIMIEGALRIEDA